MPTLRVHRGEVTGKVLFGRGVGVDRLPVGSLGDGDVTELTVPAGTHILQIRSGLYFSRPVRYCAVDGEVLEFEVGLTKREGWFDSMLGESIELRRRPKAAPVVSSQGHGAAWRMVQTVTVAP